VHLYINDQLYVREILEETVTYADRSGVTPTAVRDLRSLLTTAPTKLLAMSTDPDLITQTLAQLKSRFSPQQLYLTTSVAHFLEATHPSVNKGAAVRYLAEDLLGLKSDNVLAIGDNFNDLEMLEYAGVGVAMGDAPIAVKQVAQWVAPGVDEDGVAIAIRRFLLNAESPL
jgi:Cof subfamily protein (haloacid dehalogenase superfamily)